MISNNNLAIVFIILGILIVIIISIKHKSTTNTNYDVHRPKNIDNSKIIVINSVHYGYNWNKIVHKKIK